MYATLVKLRYLWTSIALLIIIILVGIWYTQPVDIYGLDTNMKVETINISLTQIQEDSAEDDAETRFVSFRKGEEGFDEALAKVESLELIRPFKNLMPAFPFLNKKDDVKVVDDYGYLFRIELIGAEDRSMSISCNVDTWEYRKSVYDADLPLKATENTEAPERFGDYFWELAQ